MFNARFSIKATAEKEAMDPKLISKLAKFSALSPESEHALRDALTYTRFVAPRTGPLPDTSASDDTLVILEGWAARYSLVRDGRRQITAFLLPGDHCRLSDGAQDTVAISPLTLSVIRADERKELETAHPDLAEAMVAAEHHDRVRLCGLATALGRLDAEQRIAWTLCDLWQRADAIGMIDDGHLRFPLTQPDIADHTGLTPVHVNRMMRKLREEGLAEHKGQCLTIHDYAALAAKSDYRSCRTGTSQLA
ncbi:Crp/Fnr family transcriptional regulator [Sphingomonas panacisoli]|uniref:Crp/Fnr family transcriptional regulator n=1 Tax=Sphingomonas panacisoli TaxID=1813879 RepID=A0A5B8LFD9_9SPHN|nr:Crp/Fnr family transcriptional regulator [Sphingomonas panacisoli]QDZ06783.1 Crp/Fnr family transcriptional regulator [Sphingomonas panacisoli]